MLAQFMVTLCSILVQLDRSHDRYYTQHAALVKKPFWVYLATNFTASVADTVEMVMSSILPPNGFLTGSSG
jgi:hypothetical protein